MNNLKAERTLTAERIEELLKDDLHDRNLSPRARSDLAEALIELKYLRSQSLSTQQPMGEVKVKALEWVEVTSPREDGPPEPIGEYVAETPFGSYYIDMYFGTDSYGWSANFEASDIDGSDSDSPEKAKAAAQADYERGILSALHPNQESGE